MPSQQQQLRIRERECRKHDDVRRLLDLIARLEIEIAHARGALRLRGRSRCRATWLYGRISKFGLRLSTGYSSTSGRALGIGFADEALAMAAVLAGAEPHAVGIDVDVRRVATPPSETACSRACALPR